MYEQAIMLIGLCVVFAGAVTIVFFLFGMAMNFAWKTMQNAVGFYRLAKCYRRVSRVVAKHEAKKSAIAREKGGAA